MLDWCCLQVAVAGAALVPNVFIYYGLQFLSASGLAGSILAQSTLNRNPEGLPPFSCPEAGVGGLNLTLHRFLSLHGPRQQEDCYHDNAGLYLQHRPDGVGRPGLCLVGLVRPAAGCVHRLLGHLPAVLVSAEWGLFSWRICWGRGCLCLI